jgi:hypothetical protein
VIRDHFVGADKMIILSAFYAQPMRDDAEDPNCPTCMEPMTPHGGT